MQHSVFANRTAKQLELYGSYYLMPLIYLARFYAGVMRSDIYMQ